MIPQDLIRAVSMSVNMMKSMSTIESKNPVILNSAFIAIKQLLVNISKLFAILDNDGSKIGVCDCISLRVSPWNDKENGMICVLFMHH